MPPPTGFDRSQYMTPDEVAALWDKSGEFVRGLCRSGKIDGALHLASRPGPGSRLRWWIPRSVAESYPQQAES